MTTKSSALLSTSQSTRAARTRLLTLTSWGLALFLLILGAVLRMYDLTDQPLDFHSTRQLRGAIVARGMYYEMLPGADPQQRDLAISFWMSTGQYEPPILERLAAYTYLLTGGEKIWVARVINSLFWAAGGLALFDLARRMLSTGGASPGLSTAAALTSLAYYLVLPFSVQASRSFQPDPGMVMWIVLAVYALYRWSETQSWKWAIAAGLLGGMAIVSKAVAVYILAGAAIAVVLGTLGLKRFWRKPQVWGMAGLMLAPSVLYYILLGREGRAGEYLQTWTIALSHLIFTPSTYMRWFSLLQDLMGMTALLLGLVGLVIAHHRMRVVLFGLWAGYLVYGLTLPYQMYTHSYYHLQLIPILALSLAPVALTVLEKVSQQGWIWRVLYVGIALAGLLYPAAQSVLEMRVDDYRHEPEYWFTVGSLLPTDGKILALTQDYGYRLMYYGWRKVILWPNRGEQNLSALRGSSKEFEDYFAKRSEGKNYFLVTAFKQFNDQPDLKEYLATHFPVHAEGEGYLIYDLTKPLPQP